MQGLLPRSLVVVVLVLGCGNGEPKRRSHADDDVPDRTAFASSGTSAAAPPLVLSVSLPRAHAGADFDKERFAVRIDASGKLAVDGRELSSDEELRTLARAATARTPGISALIFADRDVAYRRVIEVMDALKTEGIADFAFAVEAAASPPPAPSR